MNEIEELKRLLADALNELCAQMNAHDQDTINYVDSLIERANALGVNGFQNSESVNKTKVLRVTVLREMRGFSQARLAREAGINSSSLSRIESGKEPAYRIRGKKIADALGYAGDIDYLFDYCDSHICTFVDQAGFCDKCKHLRGKYPLNNAKKAGVGDEL